MDPLLVATSLTSIVLGSAALWLTLRTQDLSAHLRANEQDLATMAHELRSTEIAANELRRKVGGLSASLGERSQRAQALAASRDRAVTKVQEKEEQLTRLQLQLARIPYLEGQIESLQHQLGAKRGADDPTTGSHTEGRSPVAELRQPHAVLRRDLEGARATLG